MPNSLQDAIAGIVYRKILARPERFPKELRAFVEDHQRIWKVTTSQLSPPEEHMAWDRSQVWQNFVLELENMPERLPEFLAEDRE